MHTATVVDLPDGDLIDCHDFARAVARFRHPVPGEGAIGMACITGSKMVDYSFRAKPKVSVSEPGREMQQAALDFPVERFDPMPHAIPCPPLIAEVQFPLAVPGARSELSFPVALLEKDNALLEALLNILPPLKYPLSKEARERFLAAFREKMDSLQLVGEQCWEPILVPDRDGPEMMALGERFAQGLVDIVDQAGRHVETFDTRLGRGYYFLPRVVAINILEQLNLPYRDADGLSDDEELSDQTAQRDHEAGTPWTPEQAQKLHEDYLANSAKVAANMNGISLPRLYQILGAHQLPRKVQLRRKPATWLDV
ncbi:hypothetical protein M3A49_18695 [Paraburkholderia sp. CNPSo 3076]|uniref:hypothetical protein n=1 Tax=Paraburkholderia sp. CNPSo 3076 TaxID=2940936 RepID=UPI00225A6975|nr:hypothetical protein [Paraburkholderia sp. CNPSo 3076]MCX5541504.1 hypothetical protein [Paraburkholderia sp. CNPSo 3076]